MELRYDLHIHSCLSLCAEEDMTPCNIVGMAKLAGYELIAVADHQSAKNCPAVLEAARREGLLAVPAMELCTAEEVHVLCLFEELAAALSFGEYVGERLFPLPPRAQAGWRQWIMDGSDNLIGEETRYLGNAAQVGVYDLGALMKEYSGVAVPAHIDRPSFSLLSNLGFYDPSMGFATCEVSRYGDPEKLRHERADIAPLRLITGSDAHDLTGIPDAHRRLKVEEPTARAVVKALREPFAGG